MSVSIWALGLGLCLDIEYYEWLSLGFCISMAINGEALNTALDRPGSVGDVAGGADGPSDRSHDFYFRL